MSNGTYQVLPYLGEHFDNNPIPDATLIAEWLDYMDTQGMEFRGTYTDQWHMQGEKLVRNFYVFRRKEP